MRLKLGEVGRRTSLHFNQISARSDSPSTKMHPRYIDASLRPSQLQISTRTEAPTSAKTIWSPRSPFLTQDKTASDRVVKPPGSPWKGGTAAQALAFGTDS